MDEKKYAHIIIRYKALFTLIFRYVVLIVALVVSFVFFQKVLLNPGYQWEHDDPFFLQKIKLVGTFEKFLKQTIQGNDMSMYILQGPIVTQGNIISSQDNLISYRGIIVPRYFSLSTTLPLKSIEYFSTQNYDISELERVVHNFVLTNNNETDQDINKTQIPLTDTIMTTFNLSCLTEAKIYPKTCQYYLRNFFNSFFIYRLNTDYPGLQTLYAALKKEDDREQFCAGLQKYVLYANDQNTALGTLFDQCGSGYKDFFRRMGLFIDIQGQLHDRLISPDVYKDPLLNAYKLLSYQQILYRDLQDRKIRNAQYTMYLDYVKALVKRGNLSGFYVDELYRYNTYYLKNTLLAARYDTTIAGIQEQQITANIKTIDVINAGDTASGMSGLAGIILNHGLLVNASTYETGLILSTTDKMIKTLQGLSYLELLQHSNTDNQIAIKANLLINGQKVSTTIQLMYLNTTFFVRSVVLPDYPNLSLALKGLLTTTTVSLGELMSIITTDLPLYQEPRIASGTQNICDTIRGLEESLRMKVSTCNADHLAISKTINNESVTYSFLLNNFDVSSVSVSDSGLQTSLQSLLDQNNRQRGLLDLVKIILTSTPSATIQQHEGTANTIAAIENLQKYFNLIPNDIAEQNGKILIDLTLDNVNFIVSYGVKTRVLGPRYFKDILDNGTPLMIQKLSFVLNDASQDDIDSFVKDPIAYIKIVDTTAWRNYTSWKTKK